MHSIENYVPFSQLQIW